jgi:hypothetical protein
LKGGIKGNLSLQHGMDHSQRLMTHGQNGLPISFSLPSFSVVGLLEDRIDVTATDIKNNTRRKLLFPRLEIRPRPFY